MDWNSYLYGIVSMVVLLLLLLTFGIAHVGNVSAENSNYNSSNIPEKCKVPSGQDLASWKEHLGHHAETQECLKYFG